MKVAETSDLSVIRFMETLNRVSTYSQPVAGNNLQLTKKEGVTFFLNSNKGISARLNLFFATSEGEAVRVAFPVYPEASISKVGYEAYILNQAQKMGIPVTEMIMKPKKLEIGFSTPQGKPKSIFLRLMKSEFESAKASEFFRRFYDINILAAGDPDRYNDPKTTAPEGTTILRMSLNGSTKCSVTIPHNTPQQCIFSKKKGVTQADTPMSMHEMLLAEYDMLLLTERAEKLQHRLDYFLHMLDAAERLSASGKKKPYLSFPNQKSKEAVLQELMELYGSTKIKETTPEIVNPGFGEVDI
jgi:hypothetical protein